MESEINSDMTSKKEETIKLPTPEELGLVNKEETPEQKPNTDIENTEKESEAFDEVADSLEELAPPKHTKKKKQYSEVELKAMERGWKPKDYFKGDDATWRDAREFVDRGELLETITKQGRELRSLNWSMKQLSDHFQKQATYGQKRDYDDLLSRRKEAIERGDVPAVEAFDKHIIDLNQSFTRSNEQSEQQMPNEMAPQTPQNMNQPPPNMQNGQLEEALVDFQEENGDWFNGTSPETRAMMNYAIDQDNVLQQKYPHLSTSDRLHRVKKHVVDYFPRFFNKNQRRDVDQPYETVERSIAENKPVQSNNRNKFSDLPKGAQAVFKRLARHNPKLDKEKYARELFNMDKSLQEE